MAHFAVSVPCIWSYGALTFLAGPIEHTPLCRYCSPKLHRTNQNCSMYQGTVTDPWFLLLFEFGRIVGMFLTLWQVGCS